MTRPLLILNVAFFGALLSAQAQTAQPLVLHRGWDDATAKLFWHQDQGSMIMPKAWFDKLTYNDNGTVKKFSDVLEKFGFIPDPSDPKMPIGLAIHVDPNNTPWVGLTCAACHAGQWIYKGQRVIVDGAPSMLNFDAFFAALVKAAEATPDPSGQPVLNSFHLRAQMNHTKLEAGYGRVDAFGQIFNQVSIVINKSDPSTAKEPNAPASYPCLWDISQHEFVQWNGSAPNLGVEGDGSVLRNIGEVIGVFGQLEYREPSLLLPPSFESSVNFQGIKDIEHWISNLRSPQMPESFSEGSGDLVLGRQMYAHYCENCHAILQGAPQFPLPVVMVPLHQLKTDPALVNNFNRLVSTNKLERHFVFVDPDDPLETFEDTAEVAEITAYYASGVLGKLEAGDPLFFFKTLSDSLKAIAEGRPGPGLYKARPLDGVWATAPYLHNGSVPNLWQLLTAPKSRLQTFCVGNQQFDATDIGYAAQHEVQPGDCGQAFRFDTTIPGNLNTGHAYGTAEMSDAQKRALIAYLKTL